MIVFVHKFEELGQLKLHKIVQNSTKNNQNIFFCRKDNYSSPRGQRERGERERFEEQILISFSVTFLPQKLWTSPPLCVWCFSFFPFFYFSLLGSKAESALHKEK